jgi:hypothetical protein
VVVTGDPDTLKIAGMLRATLVTVPLPPADPLLAAVIRPWASTVIDACVYEPAVTAVLARFNVADDPSDTAPPPDKPVPAVMVTLEYCRAPLVISGKSVKPMALNVGVAAPPDVGPAQKRLASWVASVAASVPALVTGDPLTVKMAGKLNPTLVTVPALIDPLLAAVMRPWASTVIVACVYDPAVTAVFARFNVMAAPPSVTAPPPLRPVPAVTDTLLYCSAALVMSGKSASTNVLNVGTADEPVVGPANTTLANCATHVNDRVPVPPDMGDPETLN